MYNTYPKISPSCDICYVQNVLLKNKRPPHLGVGCFWKLVDFQSVITGEKRTQISWIPPTHQQVGETCDNIVVQAGEPIFRKLQFYVIISSAIDPKLKRPRLGLPEEVFDILLFPKNGDYIIHGDSSQLKTM